MAEATVGARDENRADARRTPTRRSSAVRVDGSPPRRDLERGGARLRGGSPPFPGALGPCDGPPRRPRARRVLRVARLEVRDPFLSAAISVSATARERAPRREGAGDGAAPRRARPARRSARRRGGGFPVRHARERPAARERTPGERPAPGNPARHLAGGLLPPIHDFLYFY